jgi:HlyD family secretion protein
LKIVLIVVGVVAVLLVVGTIFVVGAAPEGLMDVFTPEPTRTEIRTDPAQRRALVETVSAPGGIEPLTMVEISAEVAARIEELPYREGDRVRQGDVIVQLDDVDLAAALNASKARRDGERFRLQSEQARLAGLLKTLAFARKTMERQTALYETGDVSRSTLDDALERVEDLEAGIEASTHSISVIESSLAAAEANIDRAEYDLTNAVIRSPMDGVITLLNAEIGEVVMVGTMNNPGTVIMVVADLTRMILNARVAESDIASVAKGQTAKIFINAYPDEEFHGIVRKIALQRAPARSGPDHLLGPGGQRGHRGGRACWRGRGEPGRRRAAGGRAAGGHPAQPVGQPGETDRQRRLPRRRRQGGLHAGQDRGERPDAQRRDGRPRRGRRGRGRPLQGAGEDQAR